MKAVNAVCQPGLYKAYGIEEAAVACTKNKKLIGFLIL
jgi:hypothetical protein